MSGLSLLFGLEPLGLDTPYKEGLLSYFFRLAAAHRVYPGHLKSRIIMPIIFATARTRTSSEFSRLNLVNGIVSQSDQFAQALEVATFTPGLRELTLLKLNKVISPRHLNYTSKVWCPECFDEQVGQGNLYEPLIWSVASVKVCTKHNCFLNCSCPNCGETIPVFHPRMVVGYCPHCGSWLGRNGGKKVKDISSNTDIDTEIKLASDILNVLSLPFETYQKDHLAQRITEIVVNVAEGNSAELARAIGMNKATLWGWQTGKHLPPLQLLMMFSNAVGISLAQLLQGDGNYKLLKVQKTFITKDRNTRTEYDHQNIRSKLLEILNKVDEFKSAKEVAQGIGVDMKILQNHHGELLRAISTKIAQNKKRQSEIRKQIIADKIEKLMEELVSQSFYPSWRRIQAIDPSIMVRSRDGWFVWKRKMKELQSEKVCT